MRLALYQPDIPQNVGAAIRAAACFGAQIDVIEPCGFPLDSREVRRVAMDYGSSASPKAHSGWQAFLETIADSRLILLTTAAEETIWRFEFSPGDIILMGRESAGAPDEVHAAAHARLRIPLAPGVRSLNVHVAAAVTLAEARRQIGWDQG
ncbi:tRNA (cytidine(34)-2'-O)-methyltransferase [Hyphococcus sp.]|uniref:tRNA (cytidine(34)-2'-O)-methyltransferase n=1 Tax=Hyphococcus sp. TaxID=2038636 RepID=UPI00207F9B11|nr:MAG: tRNA (cytidine(34)-2'-O)-methyltransferase [Marinicaulis sp.]